MTAWTLCKQCEHPTGADITGGLPLPDPRKSGVSNSPGIEKWAGKVIRPAAHWDKDGALCVQCAKENRPQQGEAKQVVLDTLAALALLAAAAAGSTIAAAAGAAIGALWRTT